MKKAPSNITRADNPLSSFEISQKNFVMARGVMVIALFLLLFLSKTFANINNNFLEAASVLVIIFVANALFLFVGKRNRSLTKNEVFAQLSFDIIYVVLLVWLLGQGGPYFLIFCLVPVAVSAIALPFRPSLGILTLAVMGIFFAFIFLEYEAIFTLLLVLLAFVFWFYLYKISADLRRRYEGLVATETALANEQRLAALGALSTAAAHELGTPLGTITLAAKEAMNDMDADNPYREDMAVIAQEALRCREILKQLSSTHADEREDLLRRLPVEAMVQLAIDNHKTADREIIIKLQGGEKGAANEQPMVSNKPEIIHGIGNFIENAVGFSSKTIEIHIGWDDDFLRIGILDDGPGFDPTVVDKLGEPYISTRAELEEVDETVAGGLGLGVFIAKTLIERTGGKVSFRNSMMGGAQIDIVWPRAVFEEIGANSSDAGGIPWELQ